MNWIEELLERNAYFKHAAHLVEVDGLSTPRVCNLLNQLVARLSDDEVYLEIGTWKGLTVCSAALDNKGKRIVACDKFALYGKTTGLGIKAKRELERNIARYAERSASIEFHAVSSEALFARGLVPDGSRSTSTTAITRSRGPSTASRPRRPGCATSHI